MMCAISCYNGPSYNDTRLHVTNGYFEFWQIVALILIISISIVVISFFPYNKHVYRKPYVTYNDKIPHHTGIHGNIGPRGICKTPTSDYAALCGSYNSSVISYAELKAAYGAGSDCYMCGLTTDGIYFFCQGSAGYCTRDSPTGNSCNSCRNIYCKHSLGKFGQFTMIFYEGHWRGVWDRMWNGK